MGLCHGQGSPLLAGPVSHYPQCHNGLAPSRSGHGCLCRSVPRGGSWYGRWEGFSIFVLNRLEARHWVRAEYNIVLYRIHVPIIVQCKGDGRSLSSKDGAVIWESFGQLATSRLTILKMAIDDRCCPHSLINLRSISVDFTMLSLSIVILAEFGPIIFSCDHAFTHSFNEAVSLEIVFMCSRWKAWYLQGADHFFINLCCDQSFLYLETNGLGRGSSLATFSI